MARPSRHRGSTSLGCLFLAAVFGPMAVLALLWSLIAVTGGQGVTGMSGPRDELMRLMIWALLLAGALNVAGLVYAALRRAAHRRPESDWRV